jgi:hypothetical protein
MIGRYILASMLAGLAVMGTVEMSAIAAISSNETLDDEDVRPSIDVELHPTKVEPERAAFVNPLWGIPLGLLVVTRERPIFSPSRRAVHAVVAVPRSEPVTPVVRPAEPEHLNLTLVGTIVSPTESIGVFLDQSTRVFVRLRTGEQHAGWIVRSIKGRDASFEKNSRTETLSLPTSQEAGTRPAPGGDPE